MHQTVVYRFKVNMFSVQRGCRKTSEESYMHERYKRFPYINLNINNTQTKIDIYH